MLQIWNFRKIAQQDSLQISTGGVYRLFWEGTTASLAGRSQRGLATAPVVGGQCWRIPEGGMSGYLPCPALTLSKPYTASRIGGAGGQQQRIQSRTCQI